jgi:hypothetical protein
MDISASTNHPSEEPASCTNDENEPEEGDTEPNTGTTATSKKKKKSNKKKGSPSAANAPAAAGFDFHESRASMIGVRETYKGRSLFASRPIPAGTVFFSELPFSFVSTRPQCLCAICGAVVFNPADAMALTEFDDVCSQTCYDLAKQSSKFVDECNVLADCSLTEVAIACSCDVDLLRIVLRLLYKCSDDEQFVRYLNKDTNESGISSNMSYCSDDGVSLRANSHTLMALETHPSSHGAMWEASISRAFTEHIVPCMQPRILEFYGGTNSVLEFALHFAKCVNVNSYAIINNDEVGSRITGVLGFGILATVGLCVNHDCAPNCVYAYNPQTRAVEYRTTTAVTANQELCVSYIDCYATTRSRQSLLLKTRYFRCQCARCTSYTRAVTSVMSSSSSGFSDVIPEVGQDSLTCSACGKLVVGNMS